MSETEAKPEPEANAYEETFNPGFVHDYDTAKVMTEEAPIGYGFDMYPERRGKRSPSIMKWLLSSPRTNVERYKCEKQISKIVNESATIRIMTNALKHAGCPINIRRHFNCEYCESMVTGGYDQMLNQIVLCYHTSKHAGMSEAVLFHELIHMYDHCTTNIDFTNLEHLACTEIRAANLTYCSVLSGFWGKYYKRGHLRKQHAVCVKKRALESILAARPVSYEEAKAAVIKVFDKCYPDLEPIGRRLHFSQTQENLAYSESFLMGFE